jgi:hypothetical protein
MGGRDGSVNLYACAESRVRALLYYSLSNERNFHEIKRL